MAPIRTYSNDWTKRYTDDIEQVEPFRKYFFLCEGENTEKFYFEALIDSKKELGISPNVYLEFLEKTEEDRSRSAPQCLIELADKFVDDNDENFDKEFDKIVLVFDLDIYESKPNDFVTVFNDAKEKGYLLALTNPSFELFLLLHKDRSLIDIINPVEEDIVKNEWVIRDDGSRKRFISNKFYETFGFDSKSNSQISNFVFDMNIAITQEKNINQDVENSQHILTSNVGKIIENIMNNE